MSVHATQASCADVNVAEVYRHEISEQSIISFRYLKTYTFQHETGHHKRLISLQSHPIFDADMRGKQTRFRSIRNGNNDGQRNGGVCRKRTSK